MISTPDLWENCDIPETGRTSLDFDRDRLGTGGTGGSRLSGDDILPAMIEDYSGLTLYCSSVSVSVVRGQCSLQAEAD